MNPAHEILVRVLAKTDALYAPDRGGLPDRHSHLAANLAQHRRRYVARGVPWASEAAGDVHRKESQRTLDDLVLQNALVADRQAGRTIGVRLTDQADAYTRSLVALPTLAEAWPTLLLLRELTRTMRRAPETDGSTPEFRSRLICETLLLVDRDGNRKKFDYDLEALRRNEGLHSWRRVEHAAAFLSRLGHVRRDHGASRVLHHHARRSRRRAASAAETGRG